MRKRVLFSLYFVLLLISFTGCQTIYESLLEGITAPINDSIEIGNIYVDEIEPTPEPTIEPTESIPFYDEAESETENISLDEESESVSIIDEVASYTSKDDVALYIHTYNKLPSNYITKKEAQEQGWDNKENTMSDILPGMSIGGDHFGNYEDRLPKDKNRSYKECDIDYVKGRRNAKRIVFSNDGLIFYTDDHYITFEQLY